MKPRTTIEQKIESLANRLKGPTQTQIEWGFSHVLTHYCIYKSKTEESICINCGYRWRGKKPRVCPNCGRRLEVLKDSRRKRFITNGYYGILQKVEDFSLIRIFYIHEDRKLNDGILESHMVEIVQHWIADNGKSYIRARNIMPFPYYRRQPFQLSSPLSFKRDTNRHGYRNGNYHIIPDVFYPRKTYSMKLKRNGFTGDFKGFCPDDVLKELLVNNSFETLWKLDMRDFIAKYLYGNTIEVLENWRQVMLFNKWKYQTEDINIWFDYLDLLKYFNKDITNPYYLFPKDLSKEHDNLSARRQAIQEEIIHEKRMREETDKLAILDSKSKYFDISFSDGRFLVIVLKSLEDYKNEGDFQHHCVYSNKYYGKKDSIILSARFLESPETPVETIELSLKNWQILQCYGKFNKPTEYHEQIMALVNNNSYRFTRINN